MVPEKGDLYPTLRVGERGPPSPPMDTARRHRASSHAVCLCTPRRMSPIPQLLQDCLGSAKISVEGASLSGNILTDSRGRRYFAKTGYGAAAAAQMRGEARGLVAMARTAPGLAPEFIVSCSTSKSDSKEQCAMLSQYFDLGRGGDQRELARRIAQMHTPLSKLQSKGDQEPLGYGFPVPTHCGATEQDNTWEQSWEDFFRDRRLGDLVRRIDEPQITKEWEELQKKAVPLLLRDFSPAPEPVILHGDLWSGNKGFDTITGQNVIFDPACYYGHNEADLGIMHMFGGFSKVFFDEYHKIHPRSEPYYTERQKLYELYHHLNHTLMFGGGYRSGALQIMRSLNLWARSIHEKD